MSPEGRGEREPLWKEEFSIKAEEERYVSRRQFGKFLVLGSLGLFVGNLWILLKSWLWGEPLYPARIVARADEIPVKGVKLFRYPGPEDPCILVRIDQETWVAFSQKCTHLSCAVYYAAPKDRFECPCHEGFFSARDGSVLQGPPKRPLPRIVVERRGDHLVARGIEVGREA